MQQSFNPLSYCSHGSSDTPDMGILVLHPLVTSSLVVPREERFLGNQKTHSQNVIKDGTILQKNPLISSTLWLFNIAMENGPFIDGSPIKNGDFPWLC